MFAYARSGSSTESSINEIWQIIALALPSLRPKLIWVIEIFFAEMIGNC